MTYVHSQGYEFDLLDVDINDMSDAEVERYISEHAYDVVLTGGERLSQQEAGIASSAACCLGGHGTVPYEQNTQQSPGLGLRSALQPLQS